MLLLSGLLLITAATLKSPDRIFIASTNEPEKDRPLHCSFYVSCNIFYSISLGVNLQRYTNRLPILSHSCYIQESSFFTYSKDRQFSLLQKVNILRKTVQSIKSMGKPYIVVYTPGDCKNQVKVQGLILVFLLSDCYE